MPPRLGTFHFAETKMACRLAPVKPSWGLPALTYIAVAALLSSSSGGGVHAAGAAGHNGTLADGTPTERLTTARDEAKYFTFTLPSVRLRGRAPLACRGFGVVRFGVIWLRTQGVGSLVRGFRLRF